MSVVRSVKKRNHIIKKASKQRKTKRRIKTNKLILKQLTPCEELFCQYYVKDKDLMGNKIRSYMKAFNVPENKYNSASSNINYIINKEHIILRIDELLKETYGKDLNDNTVDRHLLFVIMQNFDLNAKVAGIREYNRIKGRVTHKISVTPELPKPIIEITPEYVPDNNSNKKSKSNE